MVSFLDWLLGRAAPKLTPAVATVEDSGLEDLRARIHMDVAAGYDDEDVILTHIGDYFQGEIDPEVIRREAPRILREEVAAHARATAQWPAVTDCDRLEAAFAALEEDGVVVRQNFTCCMTCGSTEIWDEIREAEEEGQTVHGYTFFHAQDTDAAVEGHGVYLAYGACGEGEGPALEVARRIVSHLEAHGLRPEWDGSWDQRIALPLDWKRRR